MLEDYPVLGFDTETTGLNVRRDKVIGYSFCGSQGDEFYVARWTWDKKTEELVECVSESAFLSVLEKIAEKELLMWNASYDIRIVKNDLGIDLIDSLEADSMLMKHTLQEEGDFRLKASAIEEQSNLGLDMEEAANKEQLELKENVAANGGSTTKANYEMYKADLNVMARYAARDAWLTFMLGGIYLKRLVEQGLEEFYFDKEVMPLYKLVTIPMEDNGVKLNLPLIQETKEKIEKDIEKLHREVMDELLALGEVQEWLKVVSSSKFPAKPTGNFAQKLAEKYNLPLPKSPKTGKYSTSKKNVEALPNSAGKHFLLTGEVKKIVNNELNRKLYPNGESRDGYLGGYIDLEAIQLELWEDFNKGLVNISSKTQMGSIVFDYMKIKPLSKTDKGNPQFNDSMIQKLEEDGHTWAKKLGDYNKLLKIKGAYIDRFLDNHEDGYYYFYYKQHGTISGRFSSDAQQLPRPKEEGELSPTVLYYNNIIRAFFVAGEGRVFIDADYESLEPHVFSHVSGDDGLRNIFRKGHDFYSTIAIQTEKLSGVSADKKAENYLGRVNKPLRQKAKAYSLGVPYGMTPFALGKSLEMSTEDAQVLYDGYLDGFPELKKWMERSKRDAQYKGFVKTETGRMRHLDRVKELHAHHGENLLNWKYRKKLEKKHGKEKVLNAYRDYKNGINNAKNVQIQGLSASIVNLSMIKINKYFKDNGIDAWVCSTIHDQIIINAPENLSEEIAPIVEDIMCNTVKLSVELKAPPEIGDNWRDTH